MKSRGNRVDSIYGLVSQEKLSATYSLGSPSVEKSASNSLSPKCHLGFDSVVFRCVMEVMIRVLKVQSVYLRCASPGRLIQFLMTPVLQKFIKKTKLESGGIP